MGKRLSRQSIERSNPGSAGTIKLQTTKKMWAIFQRKQGDKEKGAKTLEGRGRGGASTFKGRGRGGANTYRGGARGGANAFKAEEGEETTHIKVGQEEWLTIKKMEEGEGVEHRKVESKSEKQGGGLKRQRAKRNKYMPDTVPLQLPPCKICGKPASGIHYGVNSCEACKGFFRRFLKKKEPYKCSKGGDCDIQKSTGIVCSGCRLQKCFSLGMSKEGIRQGRYTLQERTNAIIEMRKLKKEEETQSNQKSKGQYSNYSIKCERDTTSESLSSSPSSSGSHDSSSRSISVKGHVKGHTLPSTENYSPDSSQNDSFNPKIIINESQASNPKIKAESSGEDSASTSHSTALPFQNSSINIPSLPVMVGNMSVGIEEQTIRTFTESLMRGYNEMKPFTKDMSDEEIHALLQDGYVKYNQKIQLFGNMDPLPANIYNEIFNVTNMDIDGRTKILELIRTELVTVIHEYVRFTHGIPAFKDLPAKDQAGLLKAARLEFFLMLCYRTLDPETGMMVSYTGHVLPIRQFCAYAPEGMSTSWLEVSCDIRRLQLQPKEHAAMLAICLTFTDRCSLENPEAVDKIQVNLLKVLQYLLKERYEEGSGRQLAKIMDVFIKLRGLNEEFLMVYKKICQDKFLIEQLPELLQFLFDE
ncbi:nuclear receptor ROR-beta-like [Saccostrea echinata]|uniref:nuclear receptor ROR-beta-like n=1 Tax=Saccostrea echinata TaxID=191078 RepID=UPI002A82BA87|nr:nuclear receptor ROR-beta-like [Saccostrea echinata]